MPKVFNGVAVWRLCWGFPPINPFLLKHFLYNFGSVLWVIVLHTTMTFWVGVFNEGEKSLFQYLSITLSIHYSIEYNDRCLSSAADSTPNMYITFVGYFGLCVYMCVCSNHNNRYICTYSSLIFIYTVLPYCMINFSPRLGAWRLAFTMVRKSRMRLQLYGSLICEY